MMLNKNDAFSIWLIGPSAAGKTTISKLLYDKIQSNKNKDYIIIHNMMLQIYY